MRTAWKAARAWTTHRVQLTCSPPLEKEESVGSSSFFLFGSVLKRLVFTVYLILILKIFKHNNVNTNNVSKPVSNKLTLIVDGNWLFMTRVFVNAKELKRDTDAAYSQIRSSFLAAIQQVLCNLPDIDNWILVCDHSSWRKKLEVPACVEVKYKGQRTSDESFNWDRIWNTYEEIKDILRSQGVTVSVAHEIEGDDWCAYWSGYLRKRGISNIIWSKGHDLMQLVKESNGAWTGWYNDVDGLYLNATQQPENQFFTMMTTGSVLLDTLRTKINKISYIDPMTDIIVEKVFNGDVSDNIKPVFHYQRTIKGGKVQTIKLPKKEIPYSIDLDSDDQVNEFIREKLTNSKYAALTFNDVKEHIEYNKKLVILNSKYYPDYIKELLLQEAPEYTAAPLEIQMETLSPLRTGTQLDDLIDLL